MGVSLTHPWALMLLALTSVVVVLFLRAERRRRQALAVFGMFHGIRHSRRASQALVVIGLMLLAVGVAAPRWGTAAPEETKVAGDVVAVLDLSRSMSAEQPSRTEIARRLLRDLGQSLKQRGGHRLGLVVFAAKAKLLVPLTRDYDHCLEVIGRFDPAQPPRTLIPAPDTKTASGTRIGAALHVAVEAHDETAKTGQHILLVSDGDDPANDEEWIDGAEAARRTRIPVHTFGVGDPNAKARIPLKDGWLSFGDDHVRSSLNEKLLQDIARRTSGQYVRVGADTVHPLSLLRTAEEVESATEAAAPPSRHVWFFAAALLFFAAALVLEKLPSPGSARVIGLRFGTISIFLLALLLVSAQAAGQDALRPGNEAFTQGKYEEAVRHFERAERWTADPGLVAFNKAAALYRLGRFREAQLHYQRCLEDDEIPPLRKAQALYNLGNCLVRQAEGKNRRLLGEAIRAYEMTLAEKIDDSLESDAKHNLEIARILWQAAPETPEEPPDAKAGDPSHKQQPATKEGQADSKSGKRIEGPGGEPNGKHGGIPKESIPGGGTSASLPDSDQPVRLASEDVLRLLADAARRIAADQRRAERRVDRAGTILKDW